jgi:hypothetical protein
MQEQCEEQALFEYRATCSLNNMGVMLMEESEFDQAFTTLKDAVYVMKDLLHLLSSKSALYSAAPCVQMCGQSRKTTLKLERAAERTALRPKASQNAESSMNIWRYSTTNTNVPRRLLASFTLICIDGSEEARSIPKTHLKLEAAIILYNFALAMQLLAKSSCCTQLLRSLKLFTSAYEILCEDGLVVTSSRHSLSHHVQHSRLYVGILTLSQMLQIQTRIGLQDELLPLQEQLDELTKAIESLRNSVNSAAAAAISTKTRATAA